MNMSSRVKHSYDASSVSMAAGTSTAAAGTTNGDSVALDRLSAAYWQADNSLASAKVGFNIVVEADDTSGDVTYTVQIDTVTGFGSAVTAFTTTNLAVGSHTVYLDESIIEHLEAGAAFVRLVVGVAAGTGTVEAGGWVVWPAND